MSKTHDSIIPPWIHSIILVHIYSNKSKQGGLMVGTVADFVFTTNYLVLTKIKNKTKLYLEVLDNLSCFKS